MLTTVNFISTSMRKHGVGLLALPLALTITYMLVVYAFPLFSVSAQDKIENGGPGMLLGMVGGAVLLG